MSETSFSVLLVLLLAVGVLCQTEGPTTNQEQVQDVIDSYADVEHIMKLMAEVAKESQQNNGSHEGMDRDSKEQTRTYYVPFKIKSFVKAWCKCDTLRGCPCKVQNGTNLRRMIEEQLVKLKRSPGSLIVYGTERIEISSLHSMSQKIRDFFRNGFHRLKAAFTRRPVDSKHHHIHVSKKHPHFLGIPKLRFFVKGIFTNSQKQSPNSG